MSNINELLEEVKSLVFSPRSIVSCPTMPATIPGITFGDIFDANDCFGTIVTLRVPKAGVIYSATLWDLDDEGTQLDLEIFKAPIAQIASDAAWGPTNAEILDFVAELQFYAFDDHGTNQTSDIRNIGKAYTASNGLFYIQAVDRSTKTIAVNSSPRFQLQIQSFDPDFVEV